MSELGSEEYLRSDYPVVVSKTESDDGIIFGDWLKKKSTPLAVREFATAAIFITFSALFAGASAQAATDWRSYGETRSISAADSQGLSYIAGDFAGCEAPQALSLGAVKLADADQSIDLPQIGSVGGEVNRIVSDGEGGFYIGGEFSSVDGVSRFNLAHINADGSVDEAWDPNPNGTVFDGRLDGIVRAKDYVYVVTNGDGIFAFHAETGEVEDWENQVTTSVHSVGYSSERDFVFYGTGPKEVGSIRALQIDPNTGAPMSELSNGGWSESAILTDERRAVWSIAVNEALNELYIGTNYSEVYRVSIDTGVVVGEPVENLSLNVEALALYGDRLFIGSDRLYAVNIENDGSFTQGFALDTVGNIYSTTATADTLFVTGSFSEIAGIARAGLAAFDMEDLLLDGSNAEPNDWAPSVGGSQVVNNLSVQDDYAFFVGEFNCVGEFVDSSTARVGADGSVHGWNPQFDGEPEAFLFTSNTLYVGGDFTSVGSEIRGRGAAFNVVDGVASLTPNDWNPDLDDSILAFALNESALYVGGDFEAAGENDRNYGAAFDMTEGVASSTANAWNPDFDDSVYALALNESALYVGGQFGAAGENDRNYGAAFDMTEGVASSTASVWNPNFDGPVNALAFSASMLFAGGDFYSVGEEYRPYAAAFDAGVGVMNSAPNDWYPEPDDSVESLAVSGDVVVVGGKFTLINYDDSGKYDGSEVARNYLAAFSIDANGEASSNPNDFAPRMEEDGDRVNALNVRPDRAIVGGRYTLAAYDLITGEVFANDADGDGLSDDEEIANGSDPLDADSDDDAVNDDTDAYPNAVTALSDSGITLTTELPVNSSSCSLQALSVTTVDTDQTGVASTGSGVGVSFTLVGCDVSSAESVGISIDLGTAPVAGSTAYKVDSNGDWTPIAGAAIDGAILTYSIIDNDGVLDQNDALGVIEDPVTVAVPAAATPAAIPVNVLPASALGILSLLIGLLGWRGLYARAARSKN